MEIAPVNLKNWSEKFVQWYELIPAAILRIPLQSTFQIQHIHMKTILRTNPNYAS